MRPKCRSGASSSDDSKSRVVHCLQESRIKSDQDFPYLRWQCVLGMSLEQKVYLAAPAPCPQCRVLAAMPSWVRFMFSASSAVCACLSRSQLCFLGRLSQFARVRLFPLLHLFDERLCKVEVRLRRSQCRPVQTSRPLPPVRCSEPILQCNPQGSIGASAVPLRFREERKSTVTGGDSRSTESKKCDRACFAPRCLLAKCFLPSSGLAVHAGLQPSSMSISQGRCRPIAASSSKDDRCTSWKLCHCPCDVVPEVLFVLQRSTFLWCVPCENCEIAVCLPVFTLIPPMRLARHLGGSCLCPAATVASRMAISTLHA